MLLRAKLYCPQFPCFTCYPERKGKGEYAFGDTPIDSGHKVSADGHLGGLTPCTKNQLRNLLNALVLLHRSENRWASIAHLG